MKEMKDRSSNFELLRIVCMLFVVVEHIIMEHHNATDLESNVSNFIRSFCIVAVNAFVLISGYFGIKYRTDRLVKLCTQTWFYSITGFLLMLYLGCHVLDLKRDFMFLIPIITKHYWFVTAYFALYCLAPFLNNAFENSSKQLMQIGLLVGFVLFYVWPTFCFIVNCDQLVRDAGFGIVNFVYLYFLGRYIRVHFESKHSYKFYLCIYLISSLVLFISQYGISKLLNFEFTSWNSYNTLFLFISSVAFFLFFKDLQIKSVTINTLAKPCLAVYLFHLAPYCWKNYVGWLGIIDAPLGNYILMILGYPILIYLIGFILENIRLFLFTGLENKICAIAEKCAIRIRSIYDNFQDHKK